MKIGIHHSKGSWSSGWIEYCDSQKIPYKIVSAYDSDIIDKLKDCDVFMWHHHHDNPKDVHFAKSLLISLELANIRVFPNTRSTWHFDDKVAQKYLFEALDLPLIPSVVIYDKKEALTWADQNEFPFVFKLKGGAGSSNVKLAKTRSEAKKLIRKSFGRGFRPFTPLVLFKDHFLKFLKGQKSLFTTIKNLGHIIVPYKIERSRGREKGYVYFQEFISGCDHDIRIQFIGDICYAMKRNVRTGDFRASGANNIEYDGSKIPIEAIRLGYEIATKLQMQTLAIDLIPYQNSWKLAEVSYAFAIDEGECDYGYYTKDLQWHIGKFNPAEKLIEYMLG